MLSPYKNASVIDFGQAELAYQVFKTGALNSLQIYWDTFVCCCKLRVDKLCKIRFLLHLKKNYLRENLIACKYQFQT